MVLEWRLLRSVRFDFSVILGPLIKSVTAVLGFFLTDGLVRSVQSS